jgi:hypothetical protein
MNKSEIDSGFVRKNEILRQIEEKILVARDRKKQRDKEKERKRKGTTENMT